MQCEFELKRTRLAVPLLIPNPYSLVPEKNTREITGVFCLVVIFFFDLVDDFLRNSLTMLYEHDKDDSKKEHYRAVVEQ